MKRLVGGAATVALSLATLVSASVVAPGGADAYWSSIAASSGSGAAEATSVNGGPQPTLTMGNLSTASNRNRFVVTWPTGTTLSNGTAVSGFTVTRYDEDGVAYTPSNGCAGNRTPGTATTCTETGVPDGLWTYAITPYFQSWTGEPGAPSAPMRADRTTPVNDISMNLTSGAASMTGTTIYYRSGTAGSFTLTNAVTDTGSGPAASISSISTAGSGWSSTTVTRTTPAGGPYISNPFSWTAGATSAPVLRVVGRDAFMNTTQTDFTVVRDITSPTGGAISYPSGATNASTVPVSLAAVADTQSGVDGGSRTIQRATAPLTGTTCGSFGSFSAVATDVPTDASTQDVPVTAGQCAMFRYVFTDAVGNSTTTTSSNVVKAKDYAGTMAGTSGLLSWYRLGDSAGDSVGTNDGSSVGNVTGSSAIGDGGASKCYNGSSHYNRVQRSIARHFSIELWLQTTQSLGSGSQWFNGAGLVDAEVANTVNDFGLSMVAGRVVAGTGNPDRSVVSGSTYNDGQWHHVVMTRVRDDVMTLYVDGVSQGTAETNGNDLTSPTNIDFGRLQTGINYFNGCLDEVALYNRALSASEVLAHFQAGNSQ